MRFLDAADLAERLPYAPLVDALAAAFRRGGRVPLRHHYAVPDADRARGTMLIMPAWQEHGAIGVKIASVFPENAAKGLPTVTASYVLLDGETGAPVAVLDGTELTARRTAAASALASRYLSRPASRVLLMVGTGRLARHLIPAHATQRPIDDVVIWGRSPDKAQALARELALGGTPARAVRSLEEAVGGADIVSCATLSSLPLVRGAWLRPGQHLDLVGGFTPEMRETDDDAVARAQVFVDTREGALHEAGDIVQPIRAGAFAADDILGDLFELVRGERAGRTADDEITLFKSVGTALEDLAAAEMAVAAVPVPAH